MAHSGSRIGVVAGAPGAAVQDLFRHVAQGWQPAVRLAGLLAEDHGRAELRCSAGYMRSLADGRRFTMFQELGAGACGCHLDGGGVAQAAEAVRADVARGCDLVILSKFGKLEAAGSGLRDAFAAAIEAGVPVLTAVSPAWRDDWHRFATPFYEILPADAARLEAWWQDVRRARADA